MRGDWCTVQLMAQAFWKKWIKFYLSTLIPTPKWHKSSESFLIGEVVLLNDKNVVLKKSVISCTYCESFTK